MWDNTFANTLYIHGLTHIWDMERLPIQMSDEAGEAGLRMAARFAGIQDFMVFFLPKYENNRIELRNTVSARFTQIFLH